MTTVSSNPVDTLSITTTRLSQNIGALIEGIHISGEITDAEVEYIRTTLATHKVVAFRNQHHVDDEVQHAFAQRLGIPTLAHPTVTSRGKDHLSIEGAANSWHTDVSFVDRIPKASILRSPIIPSYGGATQWANTVAAYNKLPEPLRIFVDNLWAVHSNEFDYVSSGVERSDRQKAYHEEFVSTYYETEHPVVHLHPETGERSLLLGHFVRNFVGLRPNESADIFRILQERILKPDNTFRWQWSEGDLVIWDNHATQHYGFADFGDQKRVVRRVTLAGAVPTSINGEKSRSLLGDASHYSPIDNPRPIQNFEGDIAARPAGI
ncbi:TauD/TfdA dioxygenase family protein [Corynebacterium crudilactis]|uniref:Taurine catabolism dioxygenase n=1 Tax=Corynebacterium crudilactis TaxID=1652495 RepID=A0A172QWC5_9CORY|nr:TauD/TfdA family dioxygenase [Corynebacterium crudilactis]ANE05012.1 taurine catabolism dioxygenase [Corynebacterium crudilactis]